MADIDTQLAAYSDGELNEEAARQIEAYLQANPAAQATLAMHRQTTELLRAAFAEDLFASTAGAQISMPRRRGALAMSRVAWAVAASVVCGIFGYGAGASWPNLMVSEQSQMLTDIAEYHSVYSHETVHLVEVPAAQADHLKMWLGKRVNRKLVIPDLAEAGLTFAGGRMVVLDGAPVAELMYTREKGFPIAICIINHEGTSEKLHVDRRGMVNLAVWGDRSHTYVVVGEADPDVIRGLASQAQRQL